MATGPRPGAPPRAIENVSPPRLLLLLGSGVLPVPSEVRRDASIHVLGLILAMGGAAPAQPGSVWGWMAGGSMGVKATAQA